MPSKVRQFGDLAKQFNQIVDAIAIDSGQIQTITQEGGLDSAAIIALIDSDHLATRQSFDFGLIGGRPTTLSGYGITNAKTSAQQDSDITATIDTVRDGVATELNDLNKMASAINDDTDFFDAVKTYTLANAPLSVIQGNNYGYSHGGRYYPSPSAPTAPITNTDRFSFASDGTISNFHTTISGRGGTRDLSANNSPSHYYLCGGTSTTTNPNADVPSFYFSQITKVALTSSLTSSDIGDLLTALDGASSHQSHSHGYVAGGSERYPGHPAGFVGNSNKIQKIAYATDGNSVQTGELVTGNNDHAGHSTPHCGYISGGLGPLHISYDAIERFPFAADTHASDVGDMGSRYEYHSGNSSDTHGYVSGGTRFSITPTPLGPSSYSLSIRKFPFAVSSAISTEVGDLVSGVSGASSAGNSTSHAYLTGNVINPVDPSSSTFQKFSFASDGNAVDVSDHREGSERRAGWQS